MLNLKKLFICAAVCALVLVLFAGFAYAEGNQAGIVNGEVLNLRESPDTSAKVISQLEKGSKVAILKESNGWFEVKYNNVFGWVNSQYITIKEPNIGIGTITVECANVRSQPDTSSDIVVKLVEGAKVNVTARSGDWYKVRTANGTVGWISKGLMTVKDIDASRGDEEEITAEELAKEKDKKDGETQGEKIIAYAKKFMGVKYVWGGNTPKGFDCSGFVKYVYNNFGIDLNRVAADQAKQGTKVSKSELKEGDLVFFDTNGGLNYINHVGIYIGNGRFIHASSSRSVHKVTITDLNGGFYSKAFMTAKRFIK